MTVPSKHEVRWRKSAQFPFHARCRPYPARAAAPDLIVSLLLQVLRHQRPGAPQARGAVAVAAPVTPARAARATAPQRQRLAVEAADRRERRIALRLLSHGRDCIQITAPPAPRSLAFSKLGHRQPSCLCAASRAPAARRKKTRVLATRLRPSFAKEPPCSPPKNERGGAPTGAIFQGPRRTSGRYRPNVFAGAAARRKRLACTNRLLRARSPLGAPPRLLSRLPNAKDSGPGRASRDEAARALPPLLHRA